MRNRRYVLRKGPLVVYGADHGISKAFRNLPGACLVTTTSSCCCLLYDACCDSAQRLQARCVMRDDAQPANPLRPTFCLSVRTQAWRSRALTP